MKFTIRDTVKEVFLTTKEWWTMDEIVDRILNRGNSIVVPEANIQICVRSLVRDKYLILDKGKYKRFSSAFDSATIKKIRLLNDMIDEIASATSKRLLRSILRDVKSTNRKIQNDKSENTI